MFLTNYAEYLDNYVLYRIFKLVKNNMRKSKNSLQHRPRCGKSQIQVGHQPTVLEEKSGLSPLVLRKWIKTNTLWKMASISPMASEKMEILTDNKISVTFTSFENDNEFLQKTLYLLFNTNIYSKCGNMLLHLWFIIGFIRILFRDMDVMPYMVKKSTPTKQVDRWPT